MRTATDNVEGSMLTDISEQLASALGRPPTGDEVALAATLANIRRAEVVSFLRIEAVCARVGMSRSQVYALAAENKFPKPVRIDGARVAVWPSDSIDRWIAGQLAGTE